MRARNLALGALLWSASAVGGEWSGYGSGEARGFANAPLDDRQHNGNLSLAAQPEYFHDWDDGKQRISFTPFARWDEHDEERTHADIRELLWSKVSDAWELRAGVGKVFWGVTESQHLVDIVNQTDLVESTDGEEKLGQPMVNLALIRDWGTLNLFVLPGFRERTFPGVEGRLRTQPYVDTDRALYESSAEDRHVDFAARWSHFVGDWDIGLSYFRGTGRDPRFALDMSGAEPVLLPYYDLIRQTGLDLQATLGSWLWKLEAVHRTGQGDNFVAATGGFEYTFVGVLESQADVGVIAELLHDSRGADAPTPFENDVMLGTRLTLNDEQSSELLFGLIADRDDSPRLYRLEASRRLGESWKLSLEGQAFTGISTTDILGGFRQDDYLQLEIARYF
jgi:hypothetical protein